MRKGFKQFLIIWSILFIAFNAIVFAIPTSIGGKTVIQLVSLVSAKDAVALELLGVGELVFSKFGGSFWPAYLFINVAFFGELAAAYYVFKESNNKQFFYKLSIMRVVYSGYIMMFICGIAAMLIPDCPVWAGTIAGLLILVFTVISATKAQTAVEIISNKENRVLESISNIKRLTQLAESNCRNESNPEKKKELKKVYEALRYSDPMSNELTIDKEKEIGTNLTNIDSVLKLIEERNLIVKSNK